MDNRQAVTGQMIFVAPDLGIEKDETRNIEKIPSCGTSPFGYCWSDGEGYIHRRERSACLVNSITSGCPTNA